MQKARLVQAKSGNGGFYKSTRTNRDLAPRAKIEETILNLATALGYPTVYYALLQDTTTMYSVDGDRYQRGANLILDLSRQLLVRREKTF